MSHVKLCVLTDLEPDDVLALGIVAARGFDVKCLWVGEGNPAVKAARAATYASKLGFSDAGIVAGAASDKLFPGEPRPDGLAGDSTPPSAPYFAAFEALVAQGVDHFMCLKPPREFMAMRAADAGRADALFAQMHLALYGSFNLRCLGYEATQWITAPDTPFASVVLYQNVGGLVNDETPALGGPAPPPVRNLNPSTCPEFFSRYDPDSELARVMRVWDADVVRDCVETCEPLGGIDGPPNAVDPERWSRNRTCYDQVHANFGKQFVAADPVLAALAWAVDIKDNRAVCAPVVAAYDPAKPYPTITDAADDGSTPTKVHLLRAVVLSRFLDDLARTRWF